MDKVLALLGLSKKSGNIVSGEFAVKEAVRSQKARLVIVAEDASQNTMKLFTDKCLTYSVPCVFYSDKESLGKALGAKERSSAAVLDEGLAGAIVKKME